ncbi:hypothetical protein [Dyella lutea]|uniref:Uncharacterized protein n=1 Tax=Dyella lutea TaxID=2950441 RepID=A0ABT1FAH2_9GAMM|nr:hypothetical protein [Dyella lutea]MCP1374369.1 hypothetical protein [Dyella lutea]
MAALAHPLPTARAWRGALMPALAVLAVLAGLWLASAAPTDAPTRDDVQVNRLVHWQDAQRDWLLVADRSSHELVVYDARTGSPLQRLGADDGLGEVDSIARAGDRLLVQGGEGPAKVLILPDLHAAGLAAR